MKIIESGSPEFQGELQRITGRGETFDSKIMEIVSDVLRNVAAEGDKALFEYVARFDGITLDERTVALTDEEREDACRRVDPANMNLLQLAADRIERFHRSQTINSWFTVDEEGTELGQLVRPLERVCVYAPGGRAPYPSTVLMAAIPARVAGVEKIFLATPEKAGGIDPLIVAAAQVAGVDQIFRIGGAQAIAAFAYGTASIPRVDKIVGPGNIYVATAKRMVFGAVGIDMIAGPSEIVIIADASAPAAYVAADLLSQAEHDELAGAVLLTPEKEVARAVAAEIDQQLRELPRESIAAQSLEGYGGIVVTRDMDEAVALANRLAPEHLELMVENPREMLGKIKNAGAVFLGCRTPEAVGDYIAGPNHILPTAGTARFSSPLGVYDFVKRTSVLSFSAESMERFGGAALRFATLEGLDAHARSVEKRMQGKEKRGS